METPAVPVTQISSKKLTLQCPTAWMVYRAISESLVFRHNSGDSTSMSQYFKNLSSCYATRNMLDNPS
jgi:hypothetical protein